MRYLIYEHDVNIMTVDNAKNEEDALCVANQRLDCTDKSPICAIPAIPDRLANWIDTLKARLRRM